MATPDVLDREMRKGTPDRASAQRNIGSQLGFSCFVWHLKIGDFGTGPNMKALKMEIIKSL